MEIMGTRSREKKVRRKTNDINNALSTQIAASPPQLVVASVSFLANLGVWAGEKLRELGKLGELLGEMAPLGLHIAHHRDLI